MLLPQESAVDSSPLSFKCHLFIRLHFSFSSNSIIATSFQMGFRSFTFNAYKRSFIHVLLFPPECLTRCFVREKLLQPLWYNFFHSAVSSIASKYFLFCCCRGIKVAVMIILLCRSLDDGDCQTWRYVFFRVTVFLLVFFCLAASFRYI